MYSELGCFHFVTLGACQKEKSEKSISLILEEMLENNGVQ
jgi:hypothetical protein